MAQVNLGRIGFVNKGSWNIAVNYKLNDVVKYGGSTYAAKRPNAGVTPPTNGTDTDDWFYFVNNSDYIDKTSNQDIIGIKNFTNGVTATEISGDKTINGKTAFVVSPIVPTPTTDFQVATKKYVDDATTNRIGLIDYAYVAKDYHIVAFGGEFNRADYPKLWAYLQANPSLVKTQTQWQTEATANGGICGFFSSGNGTTTFRVPNLDKAFLRPDSRSVGSYQGDAIRNITGRANSDIVRFDTGPTDGVFSYEASVNRPRPTSTTSAFTHGLNFDASRVVPTANENRPKNIAVLPLIVAK